MRKITAILLALLSVAVMPLTAFASQTTELTTTVPAASYTLIVPDSQTVPFGAIKATVGSVDIENGSGFAVGKNVKVTITYAPFTSESVSTTIPYDLHFASVYSEGEVTDVPSGGSIYFYGQHTGEVSNTANYGDAYITMNSADWGKALGGTYTSLITFTAEVVVSE